VKAALRDQRRKDAVARHQQLLDGEPGSLVTKAERQQMFARCEAMFKNLRRVPGRMKEQQTWQVFENMVRQLEAQRAEEKRLVKPVDGGLIVSGQRLIMTPDEARQMAASR
jgi:hypothetical protein